MAQEEGQKQIYHEKQRLQLCLLHALNNLLQGSRPFSKGELDRIADGLPSVREGWNPLWFVSRPHRTLFTGNYDANVVLAALDSRGMEAVWYDRRKGTALLDLDNERVGEGYLVGILMNHPRTRMGGLVKARHWASVKKVNETWYNLDSELACPLPFTGGKTEVMHFLDQSFAEGSEAFLVYDGRKHGIRVD